MVAGSRGSGYTAMMQASARLVKVQADIRLLQGRADRAEAALGQMQSLQERVGDWHRQRWPGADMEHVALKACEEVGEVASAVLGLVGKNSATGKGDVVGEAVGVVICLMVLLDRWYPVSLFAAIEDKLAVLNDPHSGHRSSLPPPLRSEKIV